MSKIYVIRLLTGEEIVADITPSEGGITLKNPAALMVQAGRDGRPSVGLADYVMFAEKKEVFIESSHILFFYEPMIDIKNSYSSAFGSGIVLATPFKPGPNIIPFK